MAKRNTIPTTFTPKFWELADGRTTAAKEIRRRFERLQEDTGADSYQKELLCQHAIFLAIQLETMQVEAAETGEFDFGVYTQGVNALSGLLSKLKLERAVQEVVTDLKTYMREKQTA